MSVIVNGLNKNVSQQEERNKKRDKWMETLQKQSQTENFAFGDQMGLAKQIFVQVLAKAKDVNEKKFSFTKRSFELFCILRTTELLPKSCFLFVGNAETRLETIGFRVGLVLVEKIAKDLPRFNTELDKMKFLCKEFWTVSFGKQVDNLRTNHQGVYVVQDNRFFALLSFAEGRQYAEKAAVYLALPCGIIRGALSNMGITSLVTASVETLPAVKFHIHMQ